jgi:hypothetical protein
MRHSTPSSVSATTLCSSGKVTAAIQGASSADRRGARVARQRSVGALRAAIAPGIAAAAIAPGLRCGTGAGIRLCWRPAAASPTLGDRPGRSGRVTAAAPT